ncbi:translin-associated protein X [Ischnura elegans]|uniref:translin-associated protein X n=1 Tax=Ischnura elegans TaxID=197161 RepID=UPI001ED896B4|nr:translin-associated protein X [Ischnura elegans]
MSHHGKGHGQHKWNRNDHRRSDRGRNRPVVGEKAKEALENIDDNSPVLKTFREYAQELDFKHDKYERIVKISRDITIESKRIIFLLHSADKESKRAAALSEAETRLSNLSSTLFKAIAKELEGEDPYQFLRAYYPGLQEYVEAVTFYQYLVDSSLCHWKDIQKKFIYSYIPEKKCDEDGDGTEIPIEGDAVPKEVEIKTVLPPIDYIMGVADLTGELMRKCINSLGTGDISICHQTCSFVREIYRGFLGVEYSGCGYLGSKLSTLRASLAKMESSCYELTVRGTEVPSHLLAETITRKAVGDDLNDDDEGFY